MEEGEYWTSMPKDQMLINLYYNACMMYPYVNIIL